MIDTRTILSMIMFGQQIFEKRNEIERKYVNYVISTSFYVLINLYTKKINIYIFYSSKLHRVFFDLMTPTVILREK